MKLSPKLTLIPTLVMALTLASCASLQNQILAAKAFSECEFRIKGVSGWKVGGLNAAELNTWAGQAQALTFLKHPGEIPVEMNIQIEAKNKNPDRAASLSRVDWMFFLDDIELVRGSLRERIDIPKGPISLAEFPLTVELKLSQLLSGNSLKALQRLSANLRGVGTEKSALRAKVRPTIEILGIPIRSATYLEIKKDFSPVPAAEFAPKS